MSNKKNIKRAYNVFVVALLIIAIGIVISRFVHPLDAEYTDDAMVQRHVTPINTRVQGFIKEIRFEEFQYVHRGDTLAIIEDSEYRLRLAQAEANVKGSRSGSNAVSAGISTTQSNVAVASAGIEEAKVNMNNAKKDFDRFAALMKKDAVTRQQYDDAKARYDAAKARYEAASHQRQSTALIKNEQAQRLGQSHAGVSVAEAELNIARLNLSYTVIVATTDGYMGRKNIHVGQLVQPGQEIAKIVDADDVWIVANYRETQMKHIAVGSEVKIDADAIPGVTYKGKVESISAATGSAYSNVPVDNATGNFVKVEQRVPVRIRLTKDNNAADVKRLLAGLNVETEVKY
ncbi:MAG: HlyD family secretion protein [Prevotella sp.]|jgi:membrane fusion protein (multidrug efflux system)|nr:HlyD family secretion protein [Prevotella sp.]